MMCSACGSIETVTGQKPTASPSTSTLATGKVSTWTSLAFVHTIYALIDVRKIFWKVYRYTKAVTIGVYVIVEVVHIACCNSTCILYFLPQNLKKFHHLKFYCLLVVFL